MDTFIKIIFLFAFLFNISCTEKIELPNDDPRIVVTGLITNAGMQVFLSESVSKTAPNVFPAIIDAEVEVEDPNGLMIRLPLFPNNSYRSNFGAAPALNYRLQISHREIEYEAFAQMPQQIIEIDSVVHSVVQNTSTGLFQSRFTIFFGDSPQQSTYCLLRVNEGTNEIAEGLFSDQGTNGTYQNFQLSPDTLLESGTMVQVSILQFESALFEYILAVEQINANGTIGGLTIAPPNNLNGNISNGGLGNFGAATSDMIEYLVVY